MARKPPTRHLNIFLLRAGVSAKSDIFADPKGVKRVAIRDGKAKIGDLYYAESRLSEPKWVSFFDGKVDASKLGLVSASSKAAFVVKVGSRHLAITFGQGRHLLAEQAFEDDFGIRTTLNAIDPDRIRSIDAKKFDAIARLTRDQASLDAPLLDFGIDIERDIVRSVTGSPVDVTLGVRMAGRESLAISAPMTLGDVKTRLQKCLRKYRSKTPSEHLAFVDNLRPVKDRALRESLDDALVQKIIQGKGGKLGLAIPEPMDWTDASFFYSQRLDAEQFFDLTLADFLSTAGGSGKIDASLLRQRSVFVFSAAGDQFYRRWTVYKCLFGEVESDGSTYVLDTGKWYRVDKRLLDRVDRDIQAIRGTGAAIPPHRDGEAEADYNARVVEVDKRNRVLMDQKNIAYGGGRSQIEFCDVYTSSRVMLHVKRYSGSATLSHLFAQGYVSARCLLMDESFREAVTKKMPRKFGFPDPAKPISASDFEVAFVISEGNGSVAKLPFFSRCNLARVARELRQLGFLVTCSFSLKEQQ